MGRGTVFAVEVRRRLFVLQLADGSAWLFSQHSGQLVQVGDLLTGYVDIVGFRVFAYGGGFCRAYCEAGPLSPQAALSLTVVSQTPGGMSPSSEREEDVHRSVLS